MYRTIADSKSVLGLCFLILSGCAATAIQTADVTYQKAGFYSDEIKSGGVAILPVVAGQGVEGYRRPFGESLNERVGTICSGADILVWQETMRQINEAELASEYTSAISTYRETSIIDQSVVKQIGEKTQLRYLLFTTLDPPVSETTVRRSALSGDLRQDESIGVTAFAQVWDTVSGDVVWEARGESTVASNEFAYIDEEGRNPSTHTAGIADELAMKLCASSQ